MGYPDLIHLMKSPHWAIWVFGEATLVISAVLVFRFAPFGLASVGDLLLLAAVLVFVFLSFGLTCSSSIRRALVRPGALFETRHYVFLVIGGVIGLLSAAFIVARMVYFASAA